jgi:hypothetical protein
MHETYAQARDRGASPRDRVSAVVAHAYPGGEYILDHIDNGPWYGVMLDPNAHGGDQELVNDALAAWPGLPFAHWKQWADSVDVDHLHIVPKFIYQILCYESDPENGNDLAVDTEYVLGPFPDKPTATDIIASLNSIYGPVLEADVLSDLASRFNDLSVFHQHLMPLLSPISEHTVAGRQDKVREAFRTLLTAITPT